METKDVSTSSAGTVTVPALTAPAVGGGLAPALPPGALVGRGVAQTLRQLADAHNARHGEDRKKRADVRALRAAYRRGAARKPRAGRTRRQEGLARAQAHLAALAGKALPADYAADRVLLPGEEKRLAVLALEGGVPEPLEHLKAVAAELAAEPAPGQERKDAETTVETKVWSDEARAAALLARRARAGDPVEPGVPQLPRKGRTTPLPNGTRAVHEDGTVGRVEHVRAPALRAGDRLVNPVTGAHAGTVTSVRHGDGFGKEVDDKTPLGVDRQVHVDGENRGVVTMQATYTRHVPDAPDELSSHAHALSADVRGHDPAAHEDARRAHIAAADAQKAAGNEDAALNHVMFADSHRERADQGQEIAKLKPDPETPPYHVGDTVKSEVDAADLRPGDYLQHSGKTVRVADVEHHGDIAHVRFRDPELGIGHAYLKHGETRRVTRVVRPDEG